MIVVKDVLQKDHFLSPTDVILLVREANSKQDYSFDFEGIMMTNQMSMSMLKQALKDKEVKIINNNF